MKNSFWKYLFFIVATLLSVASWVYTLTLTKSIRQSEQQRVELWSEAYKEVQRVDVEQQISPLVLKIIQSNNYIPVILCDSKMRIISYANLDKNKAKDTAYLYRQLKIMQAQNKPIVIDLGDGVKNYLFYKDSKVLTELSYYPVIQLLVALIFLLVIFVAARTTKKAEEHYLWVAMSKETAHQIGTPLSSLVAWIEMLKISGLDQRLITEVEKDVQRLEKITERFSKIGSKPELQPTDLYKVIMDTVEYLKRRSPKRVKYHIIFETKDPVIVNLNAPLFEWVIENLAKNAIDAMSGKGEIKIRVVEKDKNVIIDFSDQGKGIPSKYHKQIFKPGYTTKKYGWGMGLALVKRIVETYHNGRIFVLSSSNKGTTFRIILKK